MPPILIRRWRLVVLFATLLAGGITLSQPTIRTNLIHALYSQTQHWGMALETVKIGGNTVVPSPHILDALALPQGYPMLAINTKQHRRKLEQMGWIKSATVTKQLPNTLVVQITEHTPIAIWQNNKTYQLVSADGDLMGHSHLNKFLNLLLLVGKDAPARVHEVTAILNRMPLIRDSIKSATLQAERRWTLTTQSGIEILFPVHDAPENADFLNTMHQDKGLLNRDIIRIDLRIPDRMVIKLRTQPKTQTPKPTKPQNKQPA